MEMETPLDNAMIEKLITASFEAKEKAHCVYSEFPVGAALLCRDGTIYTGCNVECSVFSLTICAERTAIVKACSEGRKDFVAIAISSDLRESCIFPCGACRQFMVEFGVDWECLMTRTDRSYIRRNVKELLPACFTADALQEAKNNHVEQVRIPNSPYTKCAQSNSVEYERCHPNQPISTT